ncbi:MAG: B12-binding domain-containing radical SAM protein [Thermodesulfobacteriota bacterium]|nr:B12-binding domain-containing radical SAM protein [Thermodesulfobacteriota bacterium]
MPETTMEEKGPKRILLSGVFGPFGVDDAYGRKENIMELFHNQVTKAQELGSWRFQQRSFGLYFLAANIHADVTILDFPSRKGFMRELEKGYDVVGISFITPNFLKAKEMTRLTRKISPASTILIGGHGAAIDGVEDLLDCDHVIKGEGIRWLRSYLGQDPHAPIVHPTLPIADRQAAFGVPFPGVASNLLVPGVGCVNGCKFCSTTHFFGRTYTPFLSTGKEIFETAKRIADERGIDEFFVLDENFLKDRERALALLSEMERHGRYFTFHIFSSAEAVTAFGVDNLVRLGVNFVWIGFEASSSEGNFEKNRGIDARRLTKQLRDRGIIVLASGILCQEHHTQDNIQTDIDFMVALEADLVQFMLLTPLPVTALYQDHKKRGLLREDLPFEEWHGQKYLAFRHPEFPGNSAEKWLMAAFRKDYEINSSSMYRVVDTVFRGYRHLAGLSQRDACLKTRMEQFRRRSIEYAGILPLVAKYAVNETERTRATVLDREITALFGKPTLRERLRRLTIYALAMRWKLRCGFFGDRIQPPTIVTRYGVGAKKFVSASSPTALFDRVTDTLASYLSQPRPADIYPAFQLDRKRLD